MKFSFVISSTSRAWMTDTIRFGLARKRLEAFVLSRSEWCISRQRSWGVPIPALFDSAGQPLMTPDVLEHVIGVLDAKGVDYWWTGPVEEFVPPSHKGQQITKGFDTLDVWFDSGSSWTMLREANLRPRSFPLADVYLEGSDQHRGWFQSSLLTKIIGTDDRQAPYGTVITHGFVMDEEGEKMSKSAGNGLSPMQIIHGLEVSLDFVLRIKLVPRLIFSLRTHLHTVQMSLGYGQHPLIIPVTRLLAHLQYLM